MAKYTMLQLGSRGDEVKKLQELLNGNGFSLDMDGIFGEKTHAAVREYQQKMGLDVDGIVGDLTWGKLFGNGAESGSSDNQGSGGEATTQPDTTPAEPGFEYDPFNPSDETKDADNKRNEHEESKPGEFSYDPYQRGSAADEAEKYFQEHMKNKPGGYESKWQQQIEEILNKILNREDFKYDLNGDALYQQYKDQYMLQGQQAMMDTMGQAQAMTGGYGNSYAQTAGQQTYQGYLQQLNDRVPELYQLALDQYNRKGQEMYEQYGLFMDQEDQDYGRWRDSMSDYWAEYDRYRDEARYQDEKDYGRWADERDFQYGTYRDNMSDWRYDQDRYDNEYWNNWNRDYGQYNDNRNFEYDNYRDGKSDDQWEKSFEYQQGRDEKEDEKWEKEFEESRRRWDEENAKANSSGGSGGGGYDSGYDAGEDTGGDSKDDPDSPDYYADWNAGDWEAFFARYRQENGREAAEKLLNDYIKKGLIPKGMVSYGASGARGGQMGH